MIIVWPHFGMRGKANPNVEAWQCAHRSPYTERHVDLPWKSGELF